MIAQLAQIGLTLIIRLALLPNRYDNNRIMYDIQCIIYDNFYIQPESKKETLVVLQGLALLWGQQKQNTPSDSSSLPGELRLEFGFTYQISTRIFF